MRAEAELKEGPAGHATRAIAFALIHGVIARGRPLDEAFDAAMARSDLAPRDRAFVRRLSTGTLRHFGQCEAAIARLLDRKPLRPRDTALRALFAMAACELIFLGTPPHAAIDGAVALAHGRKELARHAGLLNAVLRRLAREGAGPLEATLNIPPWLRTRWQDAYGADILAAMAEAHLREPPLDLTVKGDRDEWAGALSATVLPTGTLRRTQGGRIEELPGYGDGAWWVQDAAAALPPRLLEAQPGEAVLDLCAAPGGKTAFLCALGARVTALDKDETRLARLRENLARLNLDAEIIAADLTAWSPPRLYDRILLDAPCSATGTIRRHPDMPYLKDASDLVALAGLQAAMLDAAATALRPGGTLVYAVCSMEREEGADRIADFLARHPAFARKPVAAGELALDPSFLTSEGDLRTRPDLWPEQGGLDGFFAARLTRAV